MADKLANACSNLYWATIPPNTALIEPLSISSKTGFLEIINSSLIILEAVSGLKLGNFKIGYSPERINPGDKARTIDIIPKLVAASDEEALEELYKTYSKIITAGVHKTSSIKVAEAAKVIENTQRDLNISFMNELAIIFDKMKNPNKVMATKSTLMDELKDRKVEVLLTLGAGDIDTFVLKIKNWLSEK